MFTIMDLTGYLIAFLLALIVYIIIWNSVMPWWERKMKKHINSYIEAIKKIEDI